MSSFNPTFNYTPARQLIIPNTGTEGFKTLGTIYNGIAGYMSWKDKKKQAERLQKAQDDYYETLKSYLNKNEKAPVAVEEVPQYEVPQYEVPQEEVGGTPEEVLMNMAKQQAGQAGLEGQAGKTGGDAADYAYRMELARRRQEEDQRNKLAKALIGG